MFCFVLFLYCGVKINYIIIQFVCWDEKTGYVVIMLRFQALLSFGDRCTSNAYPIDRTSADKKNYLRGYLIVAFFSYVFHR
jgi:hypothetical protein